MSLTRKVTHNRGATAAKQVLPLQGELMVLPQGGVNLFQGGVLPPYGVAGYTPELVLAQLAALIIL